MCTLPRFKRNSKTSHPYRSQCGGHSLSMINRLPYMLATYYLHPHSPPSLWRCHHLWRRWFAIGGYRLNLIRHDLRRHSQRMPPHIFAGPLCRSRRHKNRILVGLQAFEPTRQIARVIRNVRRPQFHAHLAARHGGADLGDQLLKGVLRRSETRAPMQPLQSLVRARAMCDLMKEGRVIVLRTLER